MFGGWRKLASGKFLRLPGGIIEPEWFYEDLKGKFKNKIKFVFIQKNMLQH